MKSSSIEAIETKFAPKPVGPYNQAILVENYLYCSGQIALDPSTGVMVGNGNIEEETRQVLKNLMAVVEAAGGKSSYMSPISYMNSLMLDYRSIIIPRFVYTDGSGFDDENNIIDPIKERIKELVDFSILLSKNLEL